MSRCHIDGSASSCITNILPLINWRPPKFSCLLVIRGRGLQFWKVGLEIGLDPSDMHSMLIKASSRVPIEMVYHVLLSGSNYPEDFDLSR